MAAEIIEKSSAAPAGEGWEKRTTYNEPRLSEIVEMYQKLGYEVYLQSFKPDDGTGCFECMNVSPEQYATVYTRKAASNITYSNHLANFFLAKLGIILQL